MTEKVLIIDDEADFGFLMTEFFAKKGYTGSLAKTLSEGMDILQREKFNFIFLDNHLPDGFGWSKTEFILANYPDAKLFLVSAMQVPKTSSTSFHILYKPLIKETLKQLFG
jgi:DNA-binding response OmpR family regulator